jgi:Kef-type K+ transport system membrane component KefB
VPGKEAPKWRLVAFYVFLGLATAGSAVAVITKGDSETAQPSIAGGYDLAAANPCFGSVPKPTGAALPRSAPIQPPATGASFDVRQSGRFVNFTNPEGSLHAKLKLSEDARPGGGHGLSGDVSCVNGQSLRFEGVAVGGNATTITGTAGGSRIDATLKRDPPDPGTPTKRAPGSIAGDYKSAPRSTCLGGRFEVNGGGAGYTVKAEGDSLGRLTYAKKKGSFSGDLDCAKGGKARVTGLATGRTLNNVQVIPLDEATRLPTGALTTESKLPPTGEKFSAVKQREFGKTLAVFFIAVVVVILIARLFGIAAAKLGQPRVMGEVLAGISLGPTVFGAIDPSLQATVFPEDILPALGIAANLGLIFYMFLVGLELDPSQLKGRVGQAAAISNASVAIPMILGLVVALPLYKLVAPDTKFVAFALFSGVCMSITAFPVLARILSERRMLKRPVGALALASAAIDDVTAWFLIALATAVAVAGSAGGVARTIGLAIAFCLAMALLVRPIVGRVSRAYDEAGRVPAGWIAAIFVGVLLSAFVTETIGIAVIFGAFVMGIIMPRRAELTEDVTHRVEDFVVIVLLPLFFAYTGLKTNIGLLDRPELWLLTGLLIAVAIAGKFGGAVIAARLTGFGWRPAGVIGTLMNTRGLTELIVLNLALEKGVISDALFAMLVIMALVTTFMAGPVLKLIDPRNEFGEPLEEEVDEARRQTSVEFPALEIPDRSILLAPQAETALPQLISLAEPLARSEPPRELIIARLVRPPRGADVRGGLQTQNRLLDKAAQEVHTARDELIGRGVAARAVAVVSPDPGADIARLTEPENVDLVLLEGQRRLLGQGLPRGDIGSVLREARCDVAVLVAKQGEPVLAEADAQVVVPFGGAEHDWAALELAAWIASATGAPLRLLGAAGDTDEISRVSQLLGDASLLVQQYAGVAAEPLLAEPGRDGILNAAAGASLLVIGLSERWRREGLGPTRSEIARTAPAPILFVRRGVRAGALAPREDVTRFTWSAPGVHGPATPSASIR